MSTLTMPLRRDAQLLAARLRRFAERWRQRRAWLHTRRTIEQLDDATLRDIGVTRAEAPSIAAEAVGLVDASRVRVPHSRQRAGRS